LQATNSAKPVWALVAYYGVALVAFAGFVALGNFVVTNGEPGVFVAYERALFDHSTLVAWWLTWACYPKVLIPLCVVLLILAWPLRAWRTRLLLSIVSLLVSWRAADLFQHVFARPRPLEWVVKHERSFSYPSSHAAIAFGFYILWAVLLYASGLPKARRGVAALLLATFAVAICWSRLALGAHYLTDVIGGALLGIAMGSIVLSIPAASAVRSARGRDSIAAE
jgi:membrane-associated phospholipid phosphatase